MSDKNEKNKVKPELDDEKLQRLAEEELLREAVKGAARAELVGPSGWVKPASAKTNKTFIRNTIRHALSSNRYHQNKRLYKHPASPAQIENKEGKKSIPKIHNNQA